VSNAYSTACCILQVMDALYIVNSNLADAAESWAVCRSEIEAMQHMVDNVLLRAAGGDCSTNMSVQQMSVEGSLQQCSQPAVNATSQSSELSDVAELVDRSDSSSVKSAGSAARVSRTKSAASRLSSDAKHQPSAAHESKKAVTSQKNTASKTPTRKLENASFSVKKVEPASNMTPRTTFETDQRSFDLSSSSQSSAPLSSRDSSKQTDMTTRRPSMPSKQTFKQPALPGVSKQQKLGQRKLSAASAPSCASEKTSSESSLAAGDFIEGDLPTAVATLRSSTPVTSSVGDSNDPSSISRVSSVSDASSLPASHASSSSALATSVFQPPKPSASTGKLHSHDYGNKCYSALSIARLIVHYNVYTVLH